MIRLAILILCLGALPAQAAPVIQGIGLLFGGGLFGGAGAVTIFGLATNGLVFRLLSTVALSALSTALAPKPKPAGIVTEVTQTGGVNPQSFVLGRYATGGYAAAPAMSHGASNAYLTYVIDVGDVPGQIVERLLIGGEYVDIDAAAAAHPDGYGQPVTGRYAGWMWVKAYDGAQTTADAMLIAKYGSYPSRPWTSDMIGRGVPFVILTFRFSTEVWQGLPQVQAQVRGIPLYDPRADTSVGGSGAQRWATPSTWAFSENPVVMVYNILRGIALPNGSIWGGRWGAADLPLDTWFAQMNLCDAAVTLTANRALVVDTGNFPDPGNYGLQCRDGAGAIIAAITGVVVSGASVIVTLNTTSVATIEYAYERVGGKLASGTAGVSWSDGETDTSGDPAKTSGAYGTLRAGDRDLPSAWLAGARIKDWLEIGQWPI